MWHEPAILNQAGLRATAGEMDRAVACDLDIAAAVRSFHGEGAGPTRGDRRGEAADGETARRHERRPGRVAIVDEQLDVVVAPRRRGQPVGACFAARTPPAA